jgi:hypothetical protein
MLFLILSQVYLTSINNHHIPSSIQMFSMTTEYNFQKRTSQE